MFYKAIKSGGSAKNAMDYLLRKKDNKGKVRKEIQILRGDVRLTTEIADSLDFKHKYSSSVIAFHENDKPTKEQMNEVLNKWEQVAFAGLDKERFSYYAIRHDDHIHIIAARVDLQTKRSFNPNPPSWKSEYDSFTKFFNAKYKWQRPDIQNKQSIRQNKIDIHRDMTKEMIHFQIIKNIEEGQIQSREQLKAYFENYGFKINRESDDSLSIKMDNYKPMKFKGEVYEKDFDFSKFKKGPEEIRPLDVNWEKERLEKAIEKRAEYNQKRYFKEIIEAIEDFEKKEKNQIEKAKNDRFGNAAFTGDRMASRELQERISRDSRELQSSIERDSRFIQERIDSNISQTQGIRELYERIKERFESAFKSAGSRVASMQKAISAYAQMGYAHTPNESDKQIGGNLAKRSKGVSKGGR